MNLDIQEIALGYKTRIEGLARAIRSCNLAISFASFELTENEERAARTLVAEWETNPQASIRVVWRHAGSPTIELYIRERPDGPVRPI